MSSLLATLLVALGGPMTAPPQTSVSAPDPSFLLAPLVAAGPSPELGEAVHDLDWLVGAWEAEVVDFPADGPPLRNRGEWYFAWVLEGRALQDVWIVPPRGERDGGSPPGAGNRYGTSLRVYDRETRQWRVTWINPVSGTETRLVGGRRGDDLVFTGSDGDGLLRWSFTDVQPDRFLWRGEISRDGGASWRTGAEFRLRRTVALSPRIERTYRWRWVDRPGLESLALDVGPQGVEADGEVLVVLEGEALGVTYRLAYDAGWQFRHGSIGTRGVAGERTLTIDRTAAGDWSIDGAPRPDLTACGDVDVMTTPFTNTPPLRRFALAEGESRSLRVAWVRLPELSVTAVEQEYTRLTAPAGPARYRYRNLASGFTGELTVDDEGVVIDYGPWARR